MPKILLLASTNDDSSLGKVQRKWQKWANFQPNGPDTVITHTAMIQVDYLSSVDGSAAGL